MRAKRSNASFHLSKTTSPFGCAAAGFAVAAFSGAGSLLCAGALCGAESGAAVFSVTGFSAGVAGVACAGCSAGVASALTGAAGAASVFAGVTGAAGLGACCVAGATMPFSIFRSSSEMRATNAETSVSNCGLQSLNTVISTVARRFAPLFRRKAASLRTSMAERIRPKEKFCACV